MATVFLKKGRDGRVKGGHLWVYSGEIERIEGNIEPGDFVRVVDHRGRFTAYGTINPVSSITVRIMSRSDVLPDDETLFRSRIMAAVQYRRSVCGPEYVDMNSSTGARLVFSEADLLPGLIVDKYGPYLSIQTLTAAMDRRIELVSSILWEILAPAGIYERNDVSTRKLEDLEERTGVVRGTEPEKVIIEEAGARFMVDIRAGHKTGFFLDQRQNRVAAARFAPGKSVLDVFSHTGAFGIYALLRGAKSLVSVDISEESLEVARENLALNGLSGRAELVLANGFDFLREAGRSGRRFDMIILDPPAFTKSKSSVPAALRGYKEINLRAMRLLEDGGILVSCSCSYHVDENTFLDMLLSAAVDAHKSVRIVEFRGQSVDHPVLLGHPETDYLKCVICEVRDLSFNS